MPTLDLRHYKNQKQPYVAKIIKEGAGTTLEFLPKTASRKSNDGSYGMFQVTVAQEGFYIVGNAQDDENGHRLFFTTSSGNKFPFIRKPEDISNVKAQILLGIEIGQIAKNLGLL